jgi:hypothetical protein
VKILFGVKILFDMRRNKFDNQLDLEIDSHSALTLGAGVLALGFESRTMFYFSGCRESKVYRLLFWGIARRRFFPASALALATSGADSTLQFCPQPFPVKAMAGFASKFKCCEKSSDANDHGSCV